MSQIQSVDMDKAIYFKLVKFMPQNRDANLVKHPPAIARVLDNDPIQLNSYRIIYAYEVL